MQKLFYKSLKQYCTIALRFYFYRWQVQQTAPIPRGPVIFVSNHQNAFLDAVLVACSTVRNPWFLARATVFNKEWSRKALSWLQMSPVYRFRDGFSTLRKNDEVIDTCVQLLSQQQCILIFGEGNHNDQWFLRPLQKGFARIAIAAEERSNWSLGVNIVPVGIQYESHTNFRSRVLVSFGNPVSVKENFNGDLNPQENLDQLIRKTSEGIKPLMLHIDPEDYESKFKYWRAHRQLKQDLVEQLKTDQNVVSEYPSEATPPTNSTLKTQGWWHPIRIYESINHLLPRFLLRKILKNNVKDPQFIGSIKFTLGMILVPFFYLVQTGLCFALSQSLLITLVYLISLPISVLLRR